MKKIRLISIITLLFLIISVSISENTINDITKNIPKKVLVLPSTTLLSNLKDEKTGSSFNIAGGYGSDISSNPNNKNQFYALTDRGPNASYKGKYGKGKLFPLPNYTPKIGLFEINGNGVITLKKEILLKRPDGTPITGLPNAQNLGGTGEIPYNLLGEIIRKNQNKPYNSLTNPIRVDNYGLDSEGLVALKDGSFWVSDEYGPHIVHFDKKGREIERINPFRKDARVKYTLPYEFSFREPNKGLEGLTITPDETTLVAIMQASLYNPSKKVKRVNLTRIITINPTTGETKQFLYKQDKKKNSNCAISAIGDDRFYVIERDNKLPKKGSKRAKKQIYEIDLKSGTNIEAYKENSVFKQDMRYGLLLKGKTLEEIVEDKGWKELVKYGIKPVSKKLVLDVTKEIDYPHDKVEGLWVINSHYLAVLNDDDFGIEADKKEKIKPKMLDNGQVDQSTLYIIKR